MAKDKIRDKGRNSAISVVELPPEQPSNGSSWEELNKQFNSSISYVLTLLQSAMGYSPMGSQPNAKTARETQKAVADIYEDHKFKVLANAEGSTLVFGRLYDQPKWSKKPNRNRITHNVITSTLEEFIKLAQDPKNFDELYDMIHAPDSHLKKVLSLLIDPRVKGGDKYTIKTQEWMKELKLKDLKLQGLEIDGKGSVEDKIIEILANIAEYKNLDPLNQLEGTITINLPNYTDYKPVQGKQRTSRGNIAIIPKIEGEAEVGDELVELGNASATDEQVGQAQESTATKATKISLRSALGRGSSKKYKGDNELTKSFKEAVARGEVLLHNAVLNSDVDGVNIILKIAKDINKLDEIIKLADDEGHTALYYADDKPKIKALLEEEGAVYNSKDIEEIAAKAAEDPQPQGDPVAVVVPLTEKNLDQHDDKRKKAGRNEPEDGQLTTPSEAMAIMAAEPSEDQAVELRADKNVPPIPDSPAQKPLVKDLATDKDVLSNEGSKEEVQTPRNPVDEEVQIPRNPVDEEELIPKEKLIEKERERKKKFTIMELETLADLVKGKKLLTTPKLTRPTKDESLSIYFFKNATQIIEEGTKLMEMDRSSYRKQSLLKSIFRKKTKITSEDLTRSYVGNQTILHHAILRGNLQESQTMVKDIMDLLEKGDKQKAISFINKKDYTGHTAWDYASAMGMKLKNEVWWKIAETMRSRLRGLENDLSASVVAEKSTAPEPSAEDIADAQPAAVEPAPAEEPAQSEAVEPAQYEAVEPESEIVHSEVERSQASVTEPSENQANEPEEDEVIPPVPAYDAPEPPAEVIEAAPKVAKTFKEIEEQLVEAQLTERQLAEDQLAKYIGNNDINNVERQLEKISKYGMLPEILASYYEMELDLHREGRVSTQRLNITFLHAAIIMGKTEVVQAILNSAETTASLLKELLTQPAPGHRDVLDLAVENGDPKLIDEIIGYIVKDKSLLKDVFSHESKNNVQITDIINNPGTRGLLYAIAKLKPKKGWDYLGKNRLAVLQELSLQFEAIKKNDDKQINMLAERLFNIIADDQKLKDDLERDVSDHKENSSMITTIMKLPVLPDVLVDNLFKISIEHAMTELFKKLKERYHDKFLEKLGDYKKAVDNYVTKHHGYKNISEIYSVIEEYQDKSSAEMLGFRVKEEEEPAPPPPPTFTEKVFSSIARVFNTFRQRFFPVDTQASPVEKDNIEQNEMIENKPKEEQIIEAIFEDNIRKALTILKSADSINVRRVYQNHTVESALIGKMQKISVEISGYLKQEKDNLARSRLEQLTAPGSDYKVLLSTLKAKGGEVDLKLDEFSKRLSKNIAETKRQCTVPDKEPSSLPSQKKPPLPPRPDRAPPKRSQEQGASIPAGRGAQPPLPSEERPTPSYSKSYRAKLEKQRAHTDGSEHSNPRRGSKEAEPKLDRTSTETTSNNRQR
jgi:hypothetical protein